MPPQKPPLNSPRKRPPPHNSGGGNNNNNAAAGAHPALGVVKKVGAVKQPTQQQQLSHGQQQNNHQRLLLQQQQRQMPKALTQSISLVETIITAIENHTCDLLLDESKGITGQTKMNLAVVSEEPWALQLSTDFSNLRHDVITLLQAYSVLELRTAPTLIDFGGMCNRINGASEQAVSHLETARKRLKEIYGTPSSLSLDHQTNSNNSKPTTTTKATTALVSASSGVAEATAKNLPICRPAAFFYTETHDAVFIECHAAITTIRESGKALIEVREVVQSRDLEKAMRIVAKYTSISANPLRVSGTSSSSSGASNQLSSPRTRAHANVTPYVQWLGRQWIPAMKEWRGLRDRCLENATRAASTSSPEQVRAVLDQARDEVVSRSSSIHEILLPGETLTVFVEKELEAPAKQREAESLERTKLVAKLKEAIQSCNFHDLVTSVRAADDNAAVHLCSSEEKALLAEAQQLVLDIQSVAKLTTSLSIALKSDDIVSLIRAVTQGNTLLFQFKLFGDENRCRDAIAKGNKILSSSVSSSGEVFQRYQSDDFFVEHVPSRAWATELSVMYHKSCKRIAMLMEKDATQAEVCRMLSICSSAAGLKRTDIKQLRHLLQRCEHSGVQSREAAELREIVRGLSELQLKIHYDSAIRILTIDIPEPSFDYVFSRLTAFVAEQTANNNTNNNGGAGTPTSPSSAPPMNTSAAAIRIRYQDDDGDFISVVTQSDWSVLLTAKRCLQQQQLGSAQVGGSSAILKIELFVDHPIQTPARGGGGAGAAHAAGMAPRAPDRVIAPAVLFPKKTAPPGGQVQQTNKNGPSRWNVNEDLELHTVQSVETCTTVTTTNGGTGGTALGFGNLGGGNAAALQKQAHQQQQRVVSAGGTGGTSPGGVVLTSHIGAPSKGVPMFSHQQQQQQQQQQHQPVPSSSGPTSAAAAARSGQQPVRASGGAPRGGLSAHQQQSAKVQSAQQKMAVPNLVISGHNNSSGKLR